MARYYRRGRYHSGPRTSGYGRALQHIREAEQLSRKLGGTDQDVKRYFFSLPPPRLKAVLDEYERTYGADKRAYAEETIPKWRSGRVQMSGLVAGRLYNLLPPRMPPNERYSLVQSLWEHVCPTTHKIVRAGIDISQDQIVSVVRNYVAGVAQSYYIRPQLTNRFQWLSAGDVRVKQQLLNDLLEHEKHQAVSALQVQLPVLLKHMREERDITKRLAQIVQIGKHKIEILIDPNTSGVMLEDPKPAVPFGMGQGKSGRGSLAWLWWLIAFVLFLVWLLSYK